MIILSQQDPRWSKVKLLPSSLTIGRYGCTTTCISMLSNYFKCFETPDRMIGKNTFYTGDNHPQGGGLILWHKTKFPNFAFQMRLYGRNDFEINESLKNPKKAVILAINRDSHWVVALRRVGQWIWVADPFWGKKRWIHQTIVSGSAHFISS